MKPVQTAFLSIILLLILYSCRKKEQGTLDYSKLKYDTSRIAIFTWDTTQSVFPNNSEPLPLKQEDLIIIDSLLRDAVDSFNTYITPGLYEVVFDHKFPLDSFIIKQPKYKYQLFPYKDVNGQRVVSITGFSNDFQPWKTKVYNGRLHYGISEMRLKVNLSKKKRDNLRTGDYG